MFSSPSSKSSRPSQICMWNAFGDFSCMKTNRAADASMFPFASSQPPPHAGGCGCGGASLETRPPPALPPSGGPEKFLGHSSQSFNSR